MNQPAKLFYLMGGNNGVMVTVNRPEDHTFLLKDLPVGSKKMRNGSNLLVAFDDVGVLSNIAAEIKGTTNKITEVYLSIASTKPLAVASILESVKRPQWDHYLMVDRITSYAEESVWRAYGIDNDDLLYDMPEEAAMALNLALDNRYFLRKVDYSTAPDIKEVESILGEYNIPVDLSRVTL